MPVAATPTVAATDPTSSGLVRRIPGEHLAPALRSVTSSPSTPAGVAPVPGPPVDPAAPGSPEPWGDGVGAAARDPERIRSMLSRFQASQRAGRAVATLPGDSAGDTTPDHPADTRPRPSEEDR